MKSCGCEFCNDLRNIEPAKYIGYPKDVVEYKDFFEKAKEQKKFILITESEFIVVDRCPVCGYEFTERDYDSYF